MSNTLKFGDKVTHDFGRNKGVVLDIRNDPQGYNYKVAFMGKLGVTYEDWFKKIVLIKGWDNE